MANSNGLGGSALYNLLQAANDKNFNSTQFDATNSSVANSANKVSENNTSLKNLAGQAMPNGTLSGISPGVQQFMQQDKNKIVKGNSKYQYDIFDRLQFGTPPNSPTSNGIEDYANTTLPRSSKVDNRVVINYKNYVQVEKLNPTDNNDRTFINKIKINSKFSESNFKDPSIETIVENLSTYPTTKISYADFMYCKKLGSYPNNRLVILRRFFQPVDDNLFDSPFANNQQNPLSVMVTWFDEFPFTIRYGEEWEEFSNGIVEEFSNTVSSLAPNFISKRFSNSAMSNFFKDAATPSQGGKSGGVAAPWLKTLWYQFIDDLYKNQANNVPPNFKDVLTEANPNLIQKAVIKRGLSFSVSIELSFMYTMRYINGIDPHLAMHNIMANAIRMGTSTSVSIFPKSTQFVPQFVQDLNQGKVITALQLVFTNVSDYLQKLFKQATETVSNTSVADIRSTLDSTTIDDTLNKIDASSYSRRLFSLFRFQLTAAVQADLGTPSGCWHVTIGNPFNPIVSMGDLVIRSGEGMNMKFNNELSYDDQPTEVTFTISLRNARPRGAQEIEQIFNAGRGRIYVYPQYDDDPDLYLSDTNPTMGTKQN